MHLAILMTNTDESAFAQNHPRDGEKFPALLQLVRPDWTFQSFDVKDGVFPDSVDGFDGVMITGSPASVHDSAPWVARLLDLIRTMVNSKVPMFGACFGHQAIALALDGTVAHNPGGWVHGLTHNAIVARRDWMSDLPDTVKLYGSHVEQVTALPAGAETLMQGTGCPVAGYAIGNRIYATQHHPEMTPEFIAALTDELADKMGEDVAQSARASLEDRADMRVFAESIAQFFEQAVA